MMLASCIDAAGDDGDRLLDHVAHCISQGMPELAGEFEITRKQVWRGIGSIAATHVSVHSRYEHEAAPVPTRAAAEEDETGNSLSHSHGHEHSLSHSHEHTHSHNSHEQSHEHSCDQHCHNNEHSGDAGAGNKGEKGTKHSHSHGHGEGHSHSHGHSCGPLRNLPEIRKMIQEAPEGFIPAWVKETSIEAFTELALAEAGVHGAESQNAVHFHEVGAIDSIVDTVGTLLALYFLGVETFSCSRLPIGEGTVFTDHGLLPVPAPATLRLMMGMPTTSGPPGVTGELVTPTAAALLRVLTSKYGETSVVGKPPPFTLRKVGVGAGTKDFKNHPNILRLMLGDSIFKK